MSLLFGRNPNGGLILFLHIDTIVSALNIPSVSKADSPDKLHKER